MSTIPEKPWYLIEKEASELLNYYMNTFKSDYKANKAAAIIGLFPNVLGKRLLDIGCGGGFYSLAAARRGVSEIIVSDISIDMIKTAKLNLLKNANLKIEGIVADAASLPFREESFDSILCIDLIEHVKRDRTLLGELHRVMKEGGSMILSTQNSLSLNYLLESLIERYILRKVSWMGWDPTHLRFYSMFLLNLLRHEELEPMKICGTYFIPYMLASVLNRFLGERTSKALQTVLKKINSILEKRNTTFIGYFGWGLIISSIKLSPKNSE
ncbi:class I SAM-dependent methyltransferase [Candidatus Bathyarchaeota archaeon]|nr:class I SAM-dependent methyltransferase [Candidatus Bathyarchaeota archaeon]